VLGFASDVLREKMEKPDMLEPARQAFAKALGVDVPLRCVTANAAGKAAEGNVKPGGMVAAALENGGEIVDIQ